MRICVYEDACSEWLQPVSLVRPVWELLLGPVSLLQRIVAALRPDEVALWCRSSLADLVREESPGIPVNEPLEGEWLLVNGRWVGDPRDLVRQGARDRWAMEADGSVAAARLLLGGEGPGPDGAPPADLLRSLPRRSGGARLVRYLWELLEECSKALCEEMLGRGLAGRLEGVVEEGAVLLGRERVCLATGSIVGAGAVLDARDGPIWLNRNARIGPLAVVEGPFYLGEGSVVNAAARIRGGCSFGPGVKVGGEIESSVIQGFTNKQHDGFLGHSYLGSWINLGAGTTNSDLKNNYHPVRVQLPAGEVATDRLKVGLFMGDHSTTGIGTLFTTGSVVGVGCNLFGGGMMPKSVGSFVWGDAGGLGRYRLSGMVESATIMMKRRGKELGPAREAVLRELYRQSTPGGIED